MSDFEFVQRGKVLIVKKQYQDAVKVCRLGLLAHPTLVEGRLVLGMALMALARHDEVLAEMRVALELDRLSPLGHVLKGEALLRKGDARQAVEVLGRARELDPQNERVAQLLDEAQRSARAGTAAGGAGAARAPAKTGFTEPTETKMYPAHAGASDPTGFESHSQQITTPLPFDPEQRPTQTSGQLVSRSLPRADQLEVGDRSGTIVLSSSDPALEEDSGAFASDPEDMIEAEGDDAEGDPSMLELASSDLQEVSQVAEAPRRPVPAARAPMEPTRTLPPAKRGALASSADHDEEDSEVGRPTRDRLPARAGSVSPNVVIRRPRPADEEDGLLADEEGSDGGGETGRRPAPNPALTAALAALDEDDPDGAARQQRIARASAAPSPRAERPPQAAGEGGPTRPARPLARQAAGGALPDDETARQRLRGLPTFDDSDSDAGPPPPRSSRASAPPPTRPMEPFDDLGPPPPVPAGFSPWASNGDPPAPPLPPPPDSRVLPAAPRGGAAARGTSADAPTITPPSAATPPVRQPRRSTAPTRESPERARTPLGLRPWMLAAAAVLVVAGAIFAGLLVREHRIKKAMRGLSVEAQQVAAAQTYRAYAQAEGNYRAILQNRDDAGARAALLRLRAAMAAEFGEPPDEARALLAGFDGAAGSPRGPASRDVALARAYLALAGADPDGAVRAAREAVAQFGGDAEAHYVLGRALLAQDDFAAAADELGEAVRLGATPLALTALGLAEAGRGRSEAALAAYDQALGLAEGHPAATIERARLLAATGKLPAGAEPEGALTALLREGAAAGTAAEPPLLSRAQLGWASLALAEVKLARGELPAAKGALAAAVESRPADRRFSEALIGAYLGAGDVPGARAEAERALAAFPALSVTHVWMARVALADGKPDGALVELDRAGAAAARPEALSLRGQAKLLLGDEDGAARDLDEALAARPEDRAALVARARVDLARGEARTAVARLEPLWTARPDPEIGVVYGAALRDGGDRGKARSVLESVVKSPRGRGGFIELARLGVLEGRWAEAREAYARAIELYPKLSEPRLEAALLAYDQGDAKGARDALDALALDAPQDALVLLEGARLHIVTGDFAGAEQRLEAASRLGLTAAQRGRLSRERGRLLLARREVRAAAAELKKAMAALPEDADCRFLYLDAAIALDDRDAISATLTEMLKKFSGRPEADLARARVSAGNGVFAQAIEAFGAADKGLVARSAPPRLVSEARSGLGRAYYFNNDLGRAKTALEEAARLDPSNVEAHYHLGLLLLDQGQLGPAKAAFLRATEANPGFADAWFFLGDTARQTGDRAKAVEAFRTYLKLAPRGDYAGEARRFAK